MQQNISQQKYPKAIRILHWLMGVIILALIAIGWYMAGLPKEDPTKFGFYPWHKSFGVLILLLWPFRVVIKSLARKPPYYGLVEQQIKLATYVHALMYILILLIAVSGYTMSIAGGHDVEFFGIAVPALLAENETIAGWAHEIHEYAPYVLLALVVLHVAAVIRHHTKDRVNVLKRML